MALLYRDPDIPHTTSRNTSKTVTNDPLAIIYNEGLWRLSKVTPMYKLEYTPVTLKMYASMIKQAIVSTVQASSAKYSVKIEELPNLKYSEEDCSGLAIRVTSKLQASESKEAYLAVLLSWGKNEKLEDATHLPYMLEKGAQKVGTAVKSTWQTLFDCTIKQYSFSQRQLLQFGFNFVDIDTYRDNDPFTFTYKTPQIDYKEKLSLTFDIGDISIIWTGMKEQDVPHSELVNFTYHLLQNQIFHMISLDITVFDVSEISLPKAEIKSNGVVRMKSPELVNCVFTILNEITGMSTTDSLIS